MFDLKLTLTLGDLLQTITFIVAAIALYTKLDNRVTIIETKIDMMYGWWQVYLEERASK